MRSAFSLPARGVEVHPLACPKAQAHPLQEVLVRAERLVALLRAPVLSDSLAVGLDGSRVPPSNRRPKGVGRRAETQVRDAAPVLPVVPGLVPGQGIVRDLVMEVPLPAQALGGQEEEVGGCVRVREAETALRVKPAEGACAERW